MKEDQYIGTMIDGRYSVECFLGEGGMGVVYAGRHVVMDKKVAIKFLHAEFSSNKEAVKRFYREAQAAAAIGHKNIIDVLDVGISDNNELYLIMELLKGESLESLLDRQGPIDLNTACGIMEPALLALTAAHEKEIIHRDLKPDNIFLVHNKNELPTIKLIDFGISKFTSVDGESKLTQVGTILGTPSYMSPEQIRGIEIDQRSDIYSMGVILYEMLTGSLPFEGEHYNQLLLSVITDEPKNPLDANPDFPVEAREILMSALSKNADERPQSAVEFLDGLKKISAYETRQEKLAVLGELIERESYAGGALINKTSVDEASEVAFDVLAEMSRKNTPKELSETVLVTEWNRKGIIAWMAFAIFIAVIVSVGFMVLWEREKEDKYTQVVVPVSESPPMGVEITVIGAPDDASILYESIPVSINPFRVKHADTLARIDVEAVGFNPFITSITPNTDQMVKVTLQPIEEVESKPIEEAESEPPLNNKKKRWLKKEKSGLTKGERDISFVDDFD